MSNRRSFLKGLLGVPFAAPAIERIIAQGITPSPLPPPIPNGVVRDRAAVSTAPAVSSFAGVSGSCLYVTGFAYVDWTRRSSAPLAR